MPFALPSPGTIVIIRRERWRVNAAAPAGDAVRVDATRLGPRPPMTATFFAPFDGIDAGHDRRRPRRVRRQHWHAALAHTRASAEHVTLPLAAIGARIHLLPYQLEPVLAMRAGARRILIADAVGLGKTIQAGLIIAELLRRREAARVLVAAPAHLGPQWRQELATRFRIAARVADAASLTDLAADLPRDVNPWSLDGVWIGSIDFLKQPHIVRALPLAPWDLVVIDEAHTVTGDSERRAAARVLSEGSRRVLLLTATPLSGLDDGRVLMTMGALCPRDTLTVFRRSRADVGIDRRRRTRRVRVTPTDHERRALDLVEAFAHAAESAVTPRTADATRLLTSVFLKRALSTFAALTQSIDRRLAHLSGGVPLVPAAQQQTLDFGDDDGAALTGMIGLRADRERSWLRRLRMWAANASRRERKIARLSTLLARTDEPAIVFTEFRDSLEAVARALKPRHAVVVAHGGLTPPLLHAALDAFRLGDARVLLATDVASQGLNLHHRARWVIHFDRPWNPIRLEQRAGRVDRLGQTRDVHVTELVMAHPRDEAFTERLEARAEAAADIAVLSPSARWRRPARAAARVLERRRQWSASWKGPVVRGRPLAARGGKAPVRLYEMDIAGVETVLGAAGPSGSTGARVRRVARIAGDRARRAAEVERALRARLSGTLREGQPSLPGTHAAADVRRAAQRAREVVETRRAIDARIAALDTLATGNAVSPGDSRLIFLAD